MLPSVNDLCRQITDSSLSAFPPDNLSGSRLICPEYDKHMPEVKTFPDTAFPIFLLCWNNSAPGVLNTTMLPSEKAFCYRYSFSAEEYTQPHTHDYIELSYVVQGEFRQQILGQEITFYQGDFCLLDQNCVHSDILQNNGSIILFIGISHALFDEIMQEKMTDPKITSFLRSAVLKQKSLHQYLHFIPRNLSAKDNAPHPPVSSVENIPFVPDAIPDDMANCLRELLMELGTNDSAARYICKGLLIRIFHILSSGYEVSLARENRQTINYRLFTEITDYIKENYSTICIQDLVNRFHFQEDYYNRLIKNKTGLSYSKYVQYIRLEKACDLLLSSSTSIDEIAAAVGYHNKGFFYKIFYERFHVTPNEIRRMHQAQRNSSASDSADSQF